MTLGWRVAANDARTPLPKQPRLVIQPAVYGAYNHHEGAGSPNSEP